MESVKQERKDLMDDMPVDKRASGGSFMSKHCCEYVKIITYQTLRTRS